MCTGRWTWLLALPLGLGGCGKDINGMWDLRVWSIERGGETVAVEDAGWVLFQEQVDYGSAMMLRYHYDSEAFALVPEAHPFEQVGMFDAFGYRYEKEEAEIDLRYDSPYGFFERLEFDIVHYRTSEMTLETTYRNAAYDDSFWHWELTR